MAEEHPTLPVLRQIHEGIQGTNQRLETVESQLGGLQAELHGTNQRLEAVEGQLDGLRTEVHGTNQRLETVEGQLGGLHEEMGGLRGDVGDLRTEIHDTNVGVGDLARRQVESETRLATEVVSLSKAVGEVRDLLRDRLDDHQRVNDLDRRVSVLEVKTG